MSNQDKPCDGCKDCKCGKSNLAPTTDQQRWSLEKRHWTMFHTIDPRQERWEATSGLAAVIISSFKGHIPQVKGNWDKVKEFMEIVGALSKTPAPQEGEKNNG